MIFKLAAIGATGLFTIGAQLAPIHAVTSAPPPHNSVFHTTGAFTYWQLDANKYGSTAQQAAGTRPCVRLSYEQHATSICLVGTRKARVKHQGIRGAYRIRVSITQKPARLQVRFRTADLMLRPGQPQLREWCKSNTCTASESHLGPTVIPVRVLESCSPRRKSLFSSGRSREKVVALTLDDGPSRYTKRAIRALRNAGVTATFFVVGIWANKDHSTLREIRSAGHVLGNHSYAHSDLSRLSMSAVSQDLAKTNLVVKRATGFTPCTFRAPYGANPTAVVSTARARGMVTVNWNAGAHDYRGLSTSAIVKDTLANTRPGSIILLHDGGGNRRSTIRALPIIIKELRDRGYRFLNVPDLLRLRASYR